MDDLEDYLVEKGIFRRARRKLAVMAVLHDLEEIVKDLNLWAGNMAVPEANDILIDLARHAQRAMMEMRGIRKDKTKLDYKAK